MKLGQMKRNIFKNLGIQLEKLRVRYRPLLTWCRLGLDPFSAVVSQDRRHDFEQSIEGFYSGGESRKIRESVGAERTEKGRDHAGSVFEGV